MVENPPPSAEPAVAPQDYVAAARRIAPYVRRTPLLTVSIDGREVSLKLEHLQAAGVFKIRGALNALLARREAGQRDTSVVTASGGNHGLGVATAARWLGIPATVYVPATVPHIKASRIEAAGAEVVKTGRVYADAERAARAFAAGQSRFYVHAYDDPAVVAGQGTLAGEIVADLPEVDAVAVPVGGGGLLAGVSGALAAIGRPAVVIGVEPEGCPTLHAAVGAGAGRLPGQPGRPRARQRQGDHRRPRPPVGGVPAGGRAGCRHRLRRLALRTGAGRPPLPRPVPRQPPLDP